LGLVAAAAATVVVIVVVVVVAMIMWMDRNEVPLRLGLASRREESRDESLMLICESIRR
jgi:hypothetical protein